MGIVHKPRDKADPSVCTWLPGSGRWDVQAEALDGAPRRSQEHHESLELGQECSWCGSCESCSRVGDREKVMGHAEIPRRVHSEGSPELDFCFI